ncbi:MAG: pentapeptide repeat-containing protein [Desulfobacter sp.]|nr:pentapeptide repeat-containing protein [Desulfobacter sp.]
MKKQEIQTPDTDVNALEQRWLEKALDFPGTRQAEALHTLKTSCTPGNPARPAGFDLRGINLNSQDLSGLDLSGYDLCFASMNPVDLTRANLSYALLREASLEKAVLNECEFIGADLGRTRLNECDAKNCGFGGANLSFASLINSDLSEAVLSRSSLQGADLRAADLTGARLSEADLSHAVFTRAALCDADLKHSNVAHTRFGLADLQRCRLLGIKNFKTADWVGADVRDMDLRGAYLVRRHISDENYLFEFQSQGRFYKMIYWIWWFTSDCGRSASALVCLAVYCHFGLWHHLYSAGHRLWSL